MCFYFLVIFGLVRTFKLWLIFSSQSKTLPQRYASLLSYQEARS